MVAPRFSASKTLTAIPEHSCDVRETLHGLIAFLFSRFYLNGTNSAKCTEEGRWSPELPVCARESLGPTWELRDKWFVQKFPGFSTASSTIQKPLVPRDLQSWFIEMDVWSLMGMFSLVSLYSRRGNNLPLSGRLDVFWLWTHMYLLPGGPVPAVFVNYKTPSLFWQRRGLALTHQGLP